MSICQIIQKLESEKIRNTCRMSTVSMFFLTFPFFQDIQKLFLDFSNLADTMNQIGYSLNFAGFSSKQFQSHTRSPIPPLLTTRSRKRKKIQQKHQNKKTYKMVVFKVPGFSRTLATRSLTIAVDKNSKYIVGGTFVFNFFLANTDYLQLLNTTVYDV